MANQLPERTRCIVTWWRGVPVGKDVHPCGSVADLPTALALTLEDRQRVRLMPWLATRPRRKGEAPHEPDDAADRERSWWMADELADLLPVTPVRTIPRVRPVDPRRRHRAMRRTA